LEALADGVFSIVMTLLVFEITPPKDRPVADLGRMLFDLWPSFLAFVISVGLVGIFWSAHRSQFQVIRRTDHGLNWLNLTFLAVVSLLPFSTRLIANYHAEPLALAVYGVNLSLIGLALLAVWRHATAGRRLVDEAMTDAAVRYGYSRCLVGAFGYGLGAALAFVSTPVALAVFAAVPLLYIIPSVQRAWLGRFGL
jgi:uncharacterized membrane protein